MFKRGMRLPFTLLGIPLILDWSFLLILPFLAWMIGSRVGDFADMFDVAPVEPLTEGLVPYVLGLIAAAGLFIGVVLHELGHAITARLYGVKVRSITLWFLGGVAQFEEMPRQRGAEAIVAIVGPLVSLALAGISWLVLRALPIDAVRSRFILEYLTYMNVVLAIFNMIPALPLDGGRVLRSLLAMWLPLARATQISGTVSRVLAFGIGLLGLLSFNFFLLLVAVFIFMAVSAETTTARVEDLLRDVPVSRIMNRHVSTVPPDMRLGELAQRMLQERHLGFPVVADDGRVLGWVTIAEVQGKEQNAAVSEVMAREVQSIGEDAEASEAYRMMARDGFGRIIVRDDQGRLAGIVTKTDLMRLIQIRAAGAELGPTEEDLRRGALYGGGTGGAGGDAGRLSMMRG